MPCFYRSGAGHAVPVDAKHCQCIIRDILSQVYRLAIYEVMSAPISFFEIVVGYVGALRPRKSLILGVTIILLTANLFVDLHIAHPFIMVLFLLLTCISFALFGFIIGLWATNFEKLQLIPMLVITPLVFLGGSFYSVNMLPPAWQTVTLFNPVLYLISGFRWSFFEVVRCQRRYQPGNGLPVSGGLPGSGMVDVQNRLSVEAVTA